MLSVRNICVLLCVIPGMAAPLTAMSNKINYQGIVKEGEIPIAGTRNIEFKIWDSQTGGKVLWSSGKQSVNVTEGVFSVLIGPDGNWPFDWSDPNLTPYLETLIEGQPLAPREALASVPFALATSAVSSVSSDRVKLSRNRGYLSDWQSPQDPSKINASVILGSIDSSKIQGTVTPVLHATTHRQGGGDVVQLIPSQIDGTALVSQSTGDQVLNGNLTITGTLKGDLSISRNLAVGGTLSGAQSNSVKLSSTSVFLSSWQSGTDATRIDSSKILGTVPPGPHAAIHRQGGSDAVQLTASQIDGTAIVANSGSAQVIQPTANVTALMIEGNIGSTAKVLSIFDSNNPSSEQMFVDYTGNLTLHKNANIDGNLAVGGTINGVQSNGVKLFGSGVYLSSWQSGSDPTKIDSSKIQGTVPPSSHANMHRQGGNDAVQLTAAQTDGTAIVSQPSSDQTVNRNLTISGNATVGGSLTTNGHDVIGYLIPPGMIAMFLSGCPSGWSVVGSLDGRFPMGTTDPSNVGERGGSFTHTHDMAHTHSGTTSDAAIHDHHYHGSDWEHGDGRLVTGMGSNTEIHPPAGDAQHNHTFTTSNPSPAGTSSANHMPPYTRVLFCQKN